MGFLSRFRRRTAPYTAATEEERISRYVYLLNTLPASVIESAHANAFADLPAAQRREMFDKLRPFMAESERDAASDDPIVLAKLLRRAEEHRARRAAGGADAAAATTATTVRERDEVDSREVLMGAGVMGLVANQFLMSSVIAVYFTQGAGSIGLAAEPDWVGATFDPGSTGGTGWDGGHGGLDGGGGYDGGGFDGGGFGGGFDGGGM